MLGLIAEPRSAELIVHQIAIWAASISGPLPATSLPWASSEAEGLEEGRASRAKLCLDRAHRQPGALPRALPSLSCLLRRKPSPAELSFWDVST